MAVGIEDRPMTKRNDVSVKIDADAVRIARNVATYLEQSLAEYLSQVVKDAASRRWQEILDKERGQTAPKGKGTK